MHEHPPSHLAPDMRQPSHAKPSGRGTPARSAPGWRAVLAVTLLAAAASTALVVGVLLHRDDAVVSARLPAAQPPAPQAVVPAVVGLGYLEPASTVLKVGAPGNPDSARVARLDVVDGAEVQAGQVLAVLDTSDKLAAQLAAAQAQVRLKQLALVRQRADIAYSIQSRRASLERSRAELEVARAEYQREQGLVAKGYATQSALDERQREFRKASATLAETEASARRIEATAPGESSPVDIAIAEQELAAARNDVEVARAAWEQTFIRAPIKGRILALKARAGERIGNDGLLEMGAVDTMRAVIEVYQTDVARIRVGQTAVVSSDALPAALTGRVERIGSSIRRQTVVNNDPATATDNRVVDVYLGFDASTSAAVRSLSRLQVRAKFE